MREFHGTATAFIDATPESVFDFITDINRLPEWNAAIERVVEAPGSLAYGSEWVVVMHPSGPSAMEQPLASRGHQPRRPSVRVPVPQR